MRGSQYSQALSERVKQVFPSLTHYNTGDSYHLDLFDVDGEFAAVLEPDSVFWALIDRSTDIDGTLRQEILPALERTKRRFDREMQGVRFTVAPTAVYFNPTERCNLDCTYCYLPREMRRKGRSISKARLYRSLEILGEYFSKSASLGRNKPLLVFHGSEPLLVKDLIYQAIEDFRKVFRFGIQTNGFLLESSDIRYLKRHKVSVGLSLDADIARVHDKHRKSWSGQGSFQKTVKAVEEFAGYDGFNVICTVTKANVRRLTRIVEFLHAMGVGTVLLNPVRLTQPGGRSVKPANGELSRNFIRAMERTKELFGESGRKIVVSNFANAILAIIGPTARKLMCDISPCGGGRCFFAVSATGELYPCSEFVGSPRFSGGSIFRTGVEKALLSPPFNSVRGRVVESIEPCLRCVFRNICGAPCPAEVASSDGDMRSPSPYCSFYEDLIRYAFHIIGRREEEVFLEDADLASLKYTHRIGTSS